MTAYLKKECMEYMRTGRLVILSLIFIFFGILSPAIAKLTPWMMEQLADDMEKSGFVMKNVTVTAVNSWDQFFGNAPMELIVFLLVVGGCFAAEYKSGVFVFAVTRGLRRGKIVLAKILMLTALWTLLYGVCFLITYGYTVYFWGSDGVWNLASAVFFWWLFGIWAVCLFILMATLLPTVSGALGGTAGVVIGVYLLSLVPKVNDCLPTYLMNGMSIVTWDKVPYDYTVSALVTGVSAFVFLISAVLVFRRKQL